jgi:hypothetical protein
MVLRGRPRGRVGHRRTSLHKEAGPVGVGFFALCLRKNPGPSGQAAGVDSSRLSSRRPRRNPPTAHPPLHREVRNRLRLPSKHLPLRPHPTFTGKWTTDSPSTQTSAIPTSPTTPARRPRFGRSHPHLHPAHLSATPLRLGRSHPHLHPAHLSATLRLGRSTDTSARTLSDWAAPTLTSIPHISHTSLFPLATLVEAGWRSWVSVGCSGRIAPPRQHDDGQPAGREPPTEHNDGGRRPRSRRPGS